MTPLYVAGVGLIAPGLPSWDAAAPILAGAQPWHATAAELPSPLLLPKNERRRASPTIRLALEAARQAIEASAVAPGDLPTFFGSSSGDGDILDILLKTVTDDEGRVSPTLFHNSVHNAPAGYWSIASGSQAPSMSVGAFDATVAATLLAAAVWAQRRAVLICVYDAALPEPLRSVRPIDLPFAAALVLTPTPSAAALARLGFRLGECGSAASAARTAGMTPLVETNPAARMLPLLEALARRQAGEIVISWDDAPPLAIAVTPC